MTDTTAAIAGDVIGDLAANYVTIALAGRSIGGIIPDVVIRETLVDTDVLTAHPVETGAPIVDHVYREPYQVEMETGWSDSSFGGYTGRVIDIYNALLALRATQEPFDLTTGKRLYSNMMFKEIVVTTDENSEWALMLNARLSEVIITSTSGPTNANSQFPAQTAPETPVGLQTLTPIGQGGIGSDASIPTFNSTPNLVPTSTTGVA